MPADSNLAALFGRNGTSAHPVSNGNLRTDYPIARPLKRGPKWNRRRPIWPEIKSAGLRVGQLLSATMIIASGNAVAGGMLRSNIVGHEISQTISDPRRTSHQGHFRTRAPQQATNTRSPRRRAN
jgi:hypothetical protein